MWNTQLTNEAEIHTPEVTYNYKKGSYCRQGLHNKVFKALKSDHSDALWICSLQSWFITKFISKHTTQWDEKNRCCVTVSYLFLNPSLGVPAGTHMSDASRRCTVGINERHVMVWRWTQRRRGHVLPHGDPPGRRRARPLSPRSNQWSIRRTR